MQERFGKNAVLKGMNLDRRGTTMARNRQIGGHRAGDEEEPHPRQKEKEP
jgi:DNA polymerase V